MHPHSAAAWEGAAEDRNACRALIKGGSKTFYAAAHLLPQKVRDDAYVLYAFCRISDDTVDVQGGRGDAIAKLNERLARAYAGKPFDSPVDRAFAHVVALYDIPISLPAALIEGLDWDVRGVVCEDVSDVYAYAARVAGSVGAMMSILMGVRAPDLIARACDLGVAMQLTNIARDVGEDARNGRLYLPRAWLREEGVDPDRWLRAPSFTPAIARVVAKLLKDADRLYRRADGGIAGLPLACRPGIFAARFIYPRIGTAIARNGFDSFSRRAYVPTSGKLTMIGRAFLATAVGGRVGRAVPCLPEVAFLIDAVIAAGESTFVAPTLWTRVSESILWVAHLFAALELRERERALQSSSG